MTGKIVITADTSEDRFLHTNIDVDVKNMSTQDAIATVLHLAQSLEIPLDILPDVLKLFIAAEANSEHIYIDKALIKQAVDEVGD